MEVAVGGHAWFVAPFLFILFPHDFMEFARTGAVFYETRHALGNEVAIKLENQLSEGVFITLADQGRPFLSYLFVPLRQYCYSSILLDCLHTLRILYHFCTP